MATIQLPTTEAVVSPDLLERNLAALAAHNADAAKAVRAAQPYPAGGDTMRFAETPQGVPSASWHGKSLASKHRPLDEAKRVADGIDIQANPIVVVLGFALGYHVHELGKRMGPTGVIVVFEPDLSLLRTVFEHVDCRWLADVNVLLLTDPEDGAALSRGLRGVEGLLAQGAAFCEHGPSRARLGESATVFSETFTAFVAATTTSVTTTLVQMSTTIRNTLVNLRQYVGGSGIADLKDLCKGRPGIVVSAGPSLARNVDLLAEPGVRDRCAIISVQTVLRPLLGKGIKPHFVTALDYHEISRRFYEGLTEEDVQGVQLVCEAKANSAILASFPGRIRCASDRLADHLLTDALDQPMGAIEAGATVAHLSFYLAQYLGCDPIIFIGQDLGFTDGLYYAADNPIHDVWAPELNPFNTLEMMEWQRIMRHRLRLRKTEDQHGRAIWTDEQMHTYRNQFERDFAAAPQTIIDATEGGTRKQHTVIMTLREAIDHHAGEPLPDIPQAVSDLDGERITQVREHVDHVRRDVVKIGKLSRETVVLLKRMVRVFDDRRRLNELITKVHRKREQVAALEPAFWLVNYLNQAGTFNRLRADRAIMLEKELTPIEKQRRRLERDVRNVEWIREAADELADLLQKSLDRLVDAPPDDRGLWATPGTASTRAAGRKSKSAVAAMIPVSESQLGKLAERPGADRGDDRTLLALTLSRIDRCTDISEIILIAPRGAAVDSLVDKEALTHRLVMHETDGPPIGDREQWVDAARAWAPSSWRGAIGGLTTYDQILAPDVMLDVMAERSIDAALIVGADWPVVDPALCDMVIDRHAADPKKHALVFTQAPPGLCGVVIARPVMEQLTEATPLATFGSVIGYIPIKPQADPIARDHCVKIDRPVRESLVRATCDTPVQRDALAELLGRDDADAACIVEHLEHLEETRHAAPPGEVIVELCTDRLTSGPAAVITESSDGTKVRRDPMTAALFERIAAEIGAQPGTSLTLAGVGDPLLHPECSVFVRAAKHAGIRAVHVRTDLLVESAVLDELVEARVDVVSVNLSADRAATYAAVMGVDRFRDAVLNIEHLMSIRRGEGPFRLPWIVPRLTRCDATYDDIEPFYDRWLTGLQAAVIEAMPAWSSHMTGQRLRPVPVPKRVERAHNRRVMRIHCDGSVTVCESDLTGATSVGNIADESLLVLWRRVLEVGCHE
ncbi:MAG: DUF115 domain-containing protein [Phycisphaerales bacterium]|nr:DUF115 domain-containing protein [Phycisphaerales bacterium]